MKVLYHEVDEMLEQVGQRGYGLFILGDNQLNTVLDNLL